MTLSELLFCIVQCSCLLLYKKKIQRFTSKNTFLVLLFFCIPYNSLFLIRNLCLSCGSKIQIQQKTYDAVIGDVTIVADRWQYVDFTLPYAGSALALIVPTKPKGSPLMQSRIQWPIEESDQHCTLVYLLLSVLCTQ